MADNAVTIGFLISIPLSKRLPEPVITLDDCLSRTFPRLDYYSIHQCIGNTQ